MRYLDDHLTYVGSRTATGELSRYDVYGDNRGVQLGWVARVTKSTWRAWTPDGITRIGSARWEVCASLWPS